MRRIIATLAFFLISTGAFAQGCGNNNPNCVVPTAPVGTNDNRAASTAFVSQNTNGKFLPLAGGTMTGPINVTSPVPFGTVKGVINLNGGHFLTLSGGTGGGAPDSVLGLGTGTLGVIAPTAVTNHVAAFGYFAGQALTTADHITAIGSFACAGLTTSSHNACFGIDTLRFITSGSDNVAVGEQSLNGLGDTTTSNQNTAVGRNSMLNASGDHNTGIGYFALSSSATTSLTGTYNTGIGAQSGSALNSTASSNTFVGGLAGNTASSGSNNSVFGFQSGKGLTTGSNNTIIGTNVSFTNPTTGSSNIVIGIDNNTGTATSASAGAIGIGQFVHAGTNDTCVGKGACNATNEDNNLSSAFGFNALLLLTSGDNNVAVGRSAGAAITSGAANVVIGQTTGGAIVTGSSNIIIGSAVNTPAATDVSNTINIGNVHKVTGWNVPTTAAQTLTGTITLPDTPLDTGHTNRSLCWSLTTAGLVEAGTGANNVCLGVSSMRFKTGIAPLSVGLTEVMALKPDVYYYKEGYGGPGPKYGFMAEDVVEPLPELVGLDAEGKPNTVDWAGMVPVLVKAIQELKAEVDQLKAERERR